MKLVDRGPPATMIVGMRKQPPLRICTNHQPARPLASEYRRFTGMNLQVLRRSRHWPQRGDVFALHPRGRGFFLGRVISTDARIGPMVRCVLFYIFRDELLDRPVEVSHLSASNLLVPPMMTNRQPWSRGYFDTIANRSLANGEQLSRHVFRRSLNGKLYDEAGEEVVADPAIPVGQYGLQSYRTIDDGVSQALGIPLAPD
jgi:hypothetical protein